MSRTGTPEAFNKELEKNIIDNLRGYADACEACGKIHWAKAMREASKQLRGKMSKEREECASMLGLSRADAQLMAGELSAQEWRTLSAVLVSLQNRMRSKDEND